MITGKEMRSTISGDGRLTLSIEEVSIDDPREAEIVVRVEATPINPTDLALILGPAYVTTVFMSDSSDPELTFPLTPQPMVTVDGRMCWFLISDERRVGQECACPCRSS